jgi:hypothetical protein
MTRVNAIHLSPTIIVLLTAIAWADVAFAQPLVRDTTPCDKIAPERAAVPPDFSITSRSGSAQAYRGTSTVTTLNASGQVTIKTVRRIGARKEETVRSRQVSQQAVQNIYANVVACHFFALEKSYWNRNVRDGWVSGMDVSAGGKTHSVSLYHYPVGRIQSIVSALNEALEK